MKQTLISSLKIAGETLLKYFGNPIDFNLKESQSSIVTKVDLESDSLITGFIKRKFPLHNIISEESGFSNMHSEYTWVIDPLDGTSNFAAGVPWFGVMIALFENNIPIMGGVYLPVQDQLFFAEKGKGAFKNGERFTMPESNGLKNSLFSFSVDYIDNEFILNESLGIYRNLVKATRNIRSTNSLVDFLYVAEGKFGGCINLFTKVWDISALGLILSEAGGQIKYVSGDDIQFLFDKNIVEKNFPVMAGPDKIIDELKSAVFKNIDPGITGLIL